MNDARRLRPLVATLCLLAAGGAHASDTDALRAAAAALEDKTVAWRHDFHRHPELSHQEERTAGVVAAHLESLGMAVDTGIAGHGVRGVLEGGRPGPVVALRADMDALPVTEQTGLPYASTVRTVFNGQETGVMHACGHDAHVAILMATAELLAGRRESLAGTIVFIFQPAEESMDSGARNMLAAGLFDELRPDAIFGLHVGSNLPSGIVGLRSGSLMAGADQFEIRIRGRQTHGAAPWDGVDPIVVASQVVLGLQTIASRQVNVTQAPSIISVGSIHGGIRFNIIPDEVTMVGTIRSFDEEMRSDIHRRVERTAVSIAAASGATAEVEIPPGLPVTVNDPGLTARMMPTLERALGAERVLEIPPVTWAEDFSYYANEVPAMFFFLGIVPPGVELADAAPNHSPFFVVDDDALRWGVTALSALALDFLEGA
jgi:amidohydrolase